MFTVLLFDETLRLVNCKHSQEGILHGATCPEQLDDRLEIVLNSIGYRDRLRGCLIVSRMDHLTDAGSRRIMTHSVFALDRDDFELLWLYFQIDIFSNFLGRCIKHGIFA